MRNTNPKLEGFTLIEILVAIGLIAILAAVTIIALNPAQNFIDARDAERSSEILQVLNGVSQWLVDGNSVSAIDQADAGNMSACPTMDAIAANGSVAAGNFIDLEAILVPTYIAAIPGDPQSETATDSGYEICDAGNSRVTISAPDFEGPDPITVTR